jgi:hypothetical protein
MNASPQPNHYPAYDDQIDPEYEADIRNFVREVGGHWPEKLHAQTFETIIRFGLIAVKAGDALESGVFRGRPEAERLSGIRDSALDFGRFLLEKIPSYEYEELERQRLELITQKEGADPAVDSGAGNLDAKDSVKPPLTAPKETTKTESPRDEESFETAFAKSIVALETRLRAGVLVRDVRLSLNSAQTAVLEALGSGISVSDVSQMIHRPESDILALVEAGHKQLRAFATKEARRS